MQRFGNFSNCEIDENIANTTPINTTKCHTSIWKQFQVFCYDKGHQLDGNTSMDCLGSILKDYAFNMKKTDGTDYKEGVIKTMWNITAKKLQQHYYDNFNVIFDPFKDIHFQQARNARDAKRRLLQKDPTKRKQSSTAFTPNEYHTIINSFDEDTPAGLQQKFYQIAAVELAWRGGEAANCMIEYFKEELNNRGIATGRIEYNPIFSKTTQGGAKKLADSKWLVQNKIDESVCPVRLYHKLLSKRGNKITSKRLFLTCNRFYTKNSNRPWYKNCPVGRNEISKWTRLAAEKTGLDIKRQKITNHSNRATAVSNLSQHGIEEQQLIKITGHSNASSLKPYLQLNSAHHLNIIDKMRNIPNNPTEASTSNSGPDRSVIVEEGKTEGTATYNNCNFFINCSNVTMKK